MNTKIPNEAGFGTDNTKLTPADIFEVLVDDRRRYLLHYLSQQVGGVVLGELAEQIAIWEDNPTREHYERILVSLHHTQLPKLTDAGLITYESDSETVTRLEAVDQLVPYLELAMPEDLQ